MGDIELASFRSGSDAGTLQIRDVDHSPTRTEVARSSPPFPAPSSRSCSATSSAQRAQPSRAAVSPSSAPTVAVDDGPGSSEALTGAGGALVLMLLGGAATVVIRRRQSGLAQS